MDNQKSKGITVHFVETYLIEPHLHVFYFHYQLMIKIFFFTNRSGLRSLGTLLPVLGVTWLFGILAVNENADVFQYIFVITNSFQVNLALFDIFGGRGGGGCYMRLAINWHIVKLYVMMLFYFYNIILGNFHICFACAVKQKGEW